MRKDLILKKTESFAKKALSNEGTSHDWWHIETLNYETLIVDNLKESAKFHSWL